MKPNRPLTHGWHTQQRRGDKWNPSLKSRFVMQVQCIYCTCLVFKLSLKNKVSVTL